QIDIPGQPVSDEQPAGERRRRRATAAAGSPEGASGDLKTDTKVEARTEPRTDAKTDSAAAPQEPGEGRQGKGERQDRGDRQ
ncbi:hypothetical protein, partial [Methylobacterium frigidaeris]|uniref:hypothetical protein n=1 Tax=Methylobacterium frigidaeris TaxID=2038277 RepID=UPI001EE07610